jgi:hypothetical protein
MVTQQQQLQTRARMKGVRQKKLEALLEMMAVSR